MGYQIDENYPHGWEVTDIKCIPVRTFVTELTRTQALAIKRELTRIYEHEVLLRK